MNTKLDEKIEIFKKGTKFYFDARFFVWFDFVSFSIIAVFFIASTVALRIAAFS